MTYANVIKHLPGKHDQHSHGRGGSGPITSVPKELETERMIIKLDFNPDGGRLYAEAFRKPESLDWAEKAFGADKEAAIEATLFLNSGGDRSKAYFSQMNSNQPRKGLGYETSRAIFDMLKGLGVKEVKAYVVNTNLDPVGINKKLGGRVIERAAEGNYWQFDL